MATEVWWGSGSTPAWRVLLAFAAKGVPYESKLISFSAREHKTPAFLAMNPRGKVPTIRDGDFTLNESLAILAWLDKKHPGTPLFGQTPEETGRVWRACLEFEHEVTPANNPVVRPLLFGESEKKADEVNAGIARMHEELAGLDRAVAGGRWMVGDTISAADIVWFCGVQQIVRAATRKAAAHFPLGVLPLGERYPSIVAWAARIEAIPGYDATIPPHWLESDPPSPRRLS